MQYDTQMAAFIPENLVFTVNEAQATAFVDEVSGTYRDYLGHQQKYRSPTLRSHLEAVLGAGGVINRKDIVDAFYESSACIRVQNFCSYLRAVADVIEKASLRRVVSDFPEDGEPEKPKKGNSHEARRKAMPI